LLSGLALKKNIVMSINYYQTVEMTEEQKRKMYSKCTKKQLIGFIIQLEKLKQNVLDYVYTGDYTGDSIEESLRKQHEKYLINSGYTIITI